MAPHRPRKPAPVEYTTDEEDMIVYDVENEIESNPDYEKKMEKRIIRIRFGAQNLDLQGGANIVHYATDPIAPIPELNQCEERYVIFVDHPTRLLSLLDSRPSLKLRCHSQTLDFVMVDSPYTLLTISKVSMGVLPTRCQNLMSNAVQEKLRLFCIAKQS
ncbi:hypothetical protein TNCV_4481291 [Trichonephila clavipes]|nr:hypothetical protein TNCV_4481291 [Trichonephila clavipes]